MRKSGLRIKRAVAPVWWSFQDGVVGSFFIVSDPICSLDKRLSQKLDTHDQAITGILNTLRALMQPPTQSEPEPAPPPKRPIGFVHPEEKKPPQKPKAGKR